MTERRGGGDTSDVDGPCKRMLGWCAECLLDVMVCVIVIAVAVSFAGIHMVVNAGIASVMLGPVVSDSPPSVEVVPGRKRPPMPTSRETAQDRSAGSHGVASSLPDSRM